MMDSPTNVDRAASVTEALDIFARCQGLVDEDVATQVSDLICNLMHYCDKEGIASFATVERAVGLYASERVAENDLGPDLFAKLTLDSIAPEAALIAARRAYDQTLSATRSDD